MEENRYLKLLSIESNEQAYAKVRELASGLSDEEHAIRSCIFDVHAAVEIELQRIFYHTFKAHLAFTSDEKQNEHTTSLRWPAIDNYSAWAEYDDEEAARWSAPRLGRGADYLLEPVLAGGMMQLVATSR